MYAIVFGILFFAALAAAVFLFARAHEDRSLRHKAESQRADALRNVETIKLQDEALKKRNARLERWAPIEDANEYAARISAEARDKAGAAINEGLQQRGQLIAQGEAAIRLANDQAAGLVADAQKRAKEIAGEAYELKRNAVFYERTAQAMQNRIEGYGDRYVVPADSLLDDLAKEFGHKEAGQRLKDARQLTRSMVKAGIAAESHYVESARRARAVAFVLDAFNGKVDSILSRVKHDNVGTLAQEIRDAFSVVNFGGKAFRDTRIRSDYLAARFDELKWASIVQQLKLKQQEEQRLIREQIREEEKARREFERAIKEAAKEERILRLAIEQAEAQAAVATAAQRALYEQQLLDLGQKLREAEERNLRAMSMAQQTRRGHVYIISNIGSLGENVYKIGLTRRLEPLDRIRELGDSSVPFEFDVHALIYCEDAPALEHQLHRHFLRAQVNKVNHRKEFFRADLAEIRKEIEGLGISAQWTMAAEATQYRETAAIERKIASDPSALEAWMNRQLVLEAVEESEEELIGSTEVE